MAGLRPRVFTIPPSAPFLPTLVAALAEGRLLSAFPVSDDPLALASATIYLPTRRACRLARAIFLDVLGRDAALLPRLAPIGEPDEDEFVFAEAAAGPLASAALDLPRALRPLERRLMLAQLILRWAQTPGARTGAGVPLIANGPAAALTLADALAQLMDDLTTREVSWERLDALVPDHVDPYWQLTLSFLQIAREAWPAVLAERGAIDPAARRDRLIAAEAARLQGTRDGPVIAAGSTASMPATAALLVAIARLPHGAVVLPGLDTWLDQPSWELIAGSSDADGREVEAVAAGHPQFAMHAFLARLAIHRDEVVALSGPRAHGRERLVSEALRPAAATDRWRLPVAGGQEALRDIAVIEAANAEEEALAVAVGLRETLEDADATAALVTPDRALARRVIAALKRWNVTVEDSGGDALGDTSVGIFARLAAEAALGGLAPVTLLALAKHPILRLGGAPGGDAYATAVLERALLRGPRPRAGSAGLAHALATFRQTRERLHRADARGRITDSQLDLVDGLVTRLAAALAPLEMLAGKSRPLAEWAVRHREVIAALAADGRRGTAALASEDGAALAEMFEQVAETVTAQNFPLSPAEYRDVFREIVSERVVRRPERPGARVRILGLLEARLQNFDRVVLGGLNEGVWPPQLRSDPWLSRPMRRELGLDLPERRIGLTAHDFAQALGAPQVMLSRAAKIAGAPTVASRFLQRLAAVAGEIQWRQALGRGARYVELARRLDRPAEVRRIAAPAPKPPRSARPLRLSVTEIEHWLRDPYTIYAKHVLGLTPIEPVDTPPGARDRGTVVHGAIAEFTETYATTLPADPFAALIRLGQKHFAPLADYPEAQAFWWPRFKRIARWFAAWEVRRRDGLTGVLAELQGAQEFRAGERTFRLTTRADRIELGRDGRYLILDYKTGQLPTSPQVRAGLAPQLTLEAAMLRQGGFAGIPAGGSLAGLAYVALKGGEPAGRECPIEWRDGSPDAEADRALARLKALVTRFEDESVPYRSFVRPMWSSRYGDYDHLARVKEWSATAGETDLDIPG